MRKQTNLATLLTATALLGACATTPKHNDQLEQARDQVQTLSQDPMAPQTASRDLDAARSQLAQAQAALDKGRPVEEVTHFAYLAMRSAQTGEARIAQAKARTEVAQGEAQRNRVLLDARTREAESATAAAHEALSQAAAQAADAAASREQAQTAGAEVQRLQGEMKDLQARQTERGMVMTLSDVLFDTGAATLKPGADRAIGRLAGFLKDNPQMHIIVEGHTDSVGAESYNEKLSQDRAQAVASALLQRDIPGSRIEAIGRGESFPVATNNTAAGRQQNRRVEIIFSDANGQFTHEAHDPRAS